IKECDYTFTKKHKGFLLDQDIKENRTVNYVPISGKYAFKKSGLGLIRRFPFIGHKNRAWYNEGYQRNYSAEIRMLDICDEDILIFSDIDEIIDSRYKDEIIDMVKKNGIITVKLHFSMFYLNLFSVNWGGPKDYSYRLFIMTGKHYKSLNMSIDELRKMGERGLLQGKVYCPDKFYGFHHSWLGDEAFILGKLQSYCHEPHEHNSNILTNNQYDINKIKVALKNGESIFPEHLLEVSNDIDMLKSIDNNKNLNKYML
ncbi:hypothetical protein, partial [Vibrio aestuarianus]